MPSYPVTKERVDLRVILDSVVDGIVQIDANGIISFVNHTVSAMFGYAAEELIGRDVSLLMPEPHAFNRDFYLERYPQSNESRIVCVRREAIGKRKDGSVFDLDLGVARREDGRGGISFVGVVRDITQRKQAEALMNLQRRQIETVNRQQSLFIEGKAQARLFEEVLADVMALAECRFGILGKIARDEKLRRPCLKFLAVSEFDRLAAFGLGELDPIQQGTDLEGEDNRFARVYRNRQACIVPADAERPALAVIPLFFGDKMQGILGLGGAQNFRVDLQERLAPMLNSCGQLIDAMYRIQEQRAMALELKLAKERAEAAADAKSRFLANMSHEIRTPINAILGFSHLCLQRQAPPQVADYVKKIQLAADSLLGVVNDILDFSKIEAGKLEMEEIPFDLREVLEKVTTLFANKMEEKSLAFLVETDLAAPFGLLGDPLRLSQVLINLVGNALKFTQRGSIKLGVQCLERQGGKVTFEFSVTDTGLGMTPEQKSALFQPFVQADTSTTRRFGGTGLGLAISQQLVEYMHGQFSVDSAPGQGSRFGFTARFGVDAKSAADRAAPEEKDASPPDLRGRRILLVDDNDFNLQVGRELIELAGAQVDSATDGRQALDAVRGETYDLVLMDIQMPIMDGYEAGRAIREMYPDLPVVALTAHAMIEERGKVLAVGMNDILVKPIRPKQLYAAFARWLGQGAPRQMPDEASGESPQSGVVAAPPEDGSVPPQTGASLPSAPAGDWLDVAAGMETANGNPDFFLRMLDMFRDSPAVDVEEMRISLAAGDIEKAKRQAHTLKGMAGAIGASVLSRAAAALETLLKQNDAENAEIPMTVLQEALSCTLGAIETYRNPQAGASAQDY